MKKFFYKYVPLLWSICWATIITAASLGAAITLVKWVLYSIGVI